MLPAFQSRLAGDGVVWRIDAHARADQAIGADGDRAAAHNQQVHVDERTVSDFQAQPVIKPDWRAEVHALAGLGHEFAEQSLSFGGVFKVDAIDAIARGLRLARKFRQNLRLTVLQPVIGEQFRHIRVILLELFEIVRHRLPPCICLTIKQYDCTIL